jgi:hypothetical protein
VGRLVPSSPRYQTVTDFVHSALSMTLCPNCGYRDAVDDDWCAPCQERRAVGLYQERNEKAARQRNRNWSDATEALKERQRHHRLTADVKPKEPATAGTDPWEIAVEGVHAIRRARAAARSNSYVRERLDEAEEALRKLAWGFGEGGDVLVPVSKSSGRKPRKRRVASRTFTCRVCGEEFKAIRAAMYCSSSCNVAAYRQRKRESESIR